MACDKKNTLLPMRATAAAMVLLTLVMLCGCGKTPPVAETTQPTHRTEPPVAETTQPTQATETVPQATLVTVPELEATYEQWLAAAMFRAAMQQAVSFVPLGAYTLTETDLSDPSASQGVFFHFVYDGQEMVIRSVPIAEKRTDTGTSDLYTTRLGYATFDRVVMNPEELMMLKVLDLNELAPLIEHSGLVYLYSN